MGVQGKGACEQDAPLAHASFRSKLSGANWVAMHLQRTLKRAAVLSVPLIAGAALSTPIHASGTLTTMPHGRYQCSLPGNAAGAARILIESAHFRIASASSYRSAKGRGTYIMKGRILTFTRGPKNGERYRRVGDNALQKLDAEGKPSRLLCSRVGPKLQN